MTVLEILERYASAARMQTASGGMSTESHMKKTTVLAGCRTSLSGKDQRRKFVDDGQESSNDKIRGRTAAQLVLSELHRVQRLINQLSTRLQQPADRDGRAMDAELDLWPPQQAVAGSIYDVTTTTAFSPDTLVQMERDVRKSLTSLSSGIIDGLQRG
ncbi:hypothetical protein M406DRAFT_323039 [Cryphonectria parasitica EP155]|uniref:Uncharacterized protein n=1 Tax=Cryphonectria parasitica (strain ATCC 38755 / EP155) TaxID=660469 RepID=A0A9P4XZ50_CRYP1|nr:uncharacterized protein M406DRAFT_323039 [Cryphonectria parasitica EP155]KAF3763200.1 hypothetical protein M406DRAFT_323039 [Cryphonectria parasitica EP155]